MRNQDGRIDGIAVLALDVTEVANARREAEAANRAKDEFLAMLGHELRNPLSPILTAIRLLQLKGPPDPKLEQLRETIFRQTMHLSRLVDDLLDVGRIITGKLSLDRKPVELRAIVQQAVETCTPLIERRQHVLSVALPDTPVSLDADPDRMVQVVSNLLNNAAKYMSEGGRIELTASEEDGLGGDSRHRQRSGNRAGDAGPHLRPVPPDRDLAAPRRGRAGDRAVAREGDCGAARRACDRLQRRYRAGQRVHGAPPGAAAE